MANKETRVLKTNTFEELRQKTNEISLHLGDNELLNSNLSDKTYNFVDVSAGDSLFTGLDDDNKTIRFEVSPQYTLDNTGGYVILKDSPTIPNTFIADATIYQGSSGSPDWSGTITSISQEKILVRNTSGNFSSSLDLKVGSDTIANANVVSIIAEAYPIGILRVYKNGTEISQNLLSGGFHVVNHTGTIPLSNSPDVSEFVEGSIVYQNGSQLTTQSSVESSSNWYGVVLRASSTQLLLKSWSNVNSSFSSGSQIRVLGSSDVISSANHGGLTSVDNTYGNSIELNTDASLNDDIKIFSMDSISAINELQDDVGVTENLTTTATNLVNAINEIESVFDASTNEISAGSNAFTVTSGAFTIDSSADINLDADGADIILKDGGTEFGRFTNSSGQLVVKSGANQTVLTASNTNATFNNDLTVENNLDVVGALDVDGATTLDGTTIDGDLDLNGSVDVSTNLVVHGNSTLGDAIGDTTAISGNTTVGGTLTVAGVSTVNNTLTVTGLTSLNGGISVDTNKFTVADGTGNTAIAGTLDVDGNTTLDGTTIDGNLDLNGNADVSGTLAVGSSLTVTGATALNGGLTMDTNKFVVADTTGNTSIGGTLTVTGVVDIGTLSTNFNVANRNDVKLALNEVAAEIGANTYPAGGPADTANPSNLTSAINAIDAEIGDTAYTGADVTTAIANAQTLLGSVDITAISSSNDNVTGALAQLHTEVGSLSLNSGLGSDLTSAVNNIHGDINTAGSLTSLNTTAKYIVGAINEHESDIGDMTFTGLSATNISAAIRELETEKVYLTSSTRQTLDSQFNLDRNITFRTHASGTNTGTFTFNTGTTLDLSSATLLLPGSASSVNIFGVAFLRVDGNLEDPMGFSVDRQHVGTITDTSDVKIQWHENYADGTTASRPARAWQLVGLDDSSGTNTADIVTFYNAKELVANNTESGISVTWDAQNQNFDFDVNDFTVTLGTGPISGSFSVTNLANATFNTTLKNDSVTLGTHTVGDYVTSVVGTANEIEVTGNSGEQRSITVGLPNAVDIVDLDVTATTDSTSQTTGALTVAGGAGIAKNLYVGGNLVVQGTQTILNTETLTVEDTLVLAGNNLSSEPSSGGFGLEVGPITNPSGVASGVTGAHSIVYNYANDRWEADGSLILSEATLDSPDVKVNNGTSLGNLTGSRALDFLASTGISVSGAFSDPDFNITITNTDRGSSQNIFKNVAVAGQTTIVADSNNDTLTFVNGNDIVLTTNATSDAVTVSHQTFNTGSSNATDDGVYIRSITYDNGHVTNVETGDFDDYYYTQSSFSSTATTGNAPVIRSGGNFSAGTITAALVGNVTGNVTGNASSATQVYVTGTSTDASYRMIFGETNDGYNGNETLYKDTAANFYYNPSSNTLTATTFSGALSGNATTATTLQTTRAINGTNFNGSAAITTATWGTARTITIGGTGKSVNGSGNYSWSLAEIGAAATNQTMHIGTTAVAINRASAALSLTGVSIDGTATNADNINVDEKNDNTAYQILFSAQDGSGYQRPYIDSDNTHLIYNPSTATLAGLVGLQSTHVTGNGGGNISGYSSISGTTITDGTAQLSGGYLTGASYCESAGLSTSWGTTNGTSTGAWNGIMGTSTGATWLLSGTSGGTFRAGIQALDSDGTLRFYQGTNYFTFGGNTLTANAFSGNGASLTNLAANNIATGTVAVARLGSGTASATTYLRGDGAWATIAYSHLSGTPTIGNGTLTLNVSGSGLSGSQTFTANQTGNATFTVTSNATTASTGSTIAYRDSSGDIHARLFRSEYDTTNSTIGYIMTQVDTGTNNYIRPSTPAQVRSALNVEDGAHNHAIYGYNDGTTGYVMSNGLSGSNHIYIIGGTGITVAQASNYNGTGDHGLRINCDIVNTDRYVNSASFNTSNGVLTLTRAGSDTASVTVDLDGRYVTSSGVTSVATGNGLSGGTITSTGTLTMSGAYTGNFTVTGNIYATADVVAYSTSDINLKENIQPIENALDKVSQINGVTFDWKDEHLQTHNEGWVRKRDTGVIAQEVQEVLPEVVHEKEDGTLGVRYDKMIGLLIESIKELKEQNNELRSEIEALKNINR